MEKIFGKKIVTEEGGAVMKKRFWLNVLVFVFCIASIFFSSTEAEAASVPGQKKEYPQALSDAIRNGVENKNMDLYARIAKTGAGKKAMKQAVIQNRAALMAEGIDFLDSNWSHYYAVTTVGKCTVFNSTKSVSRRTYQRRYYEIMQGLNEVLACIEPGMNDADKAMAVYYYLAKNTEYRQSQDCHTGYDVLVKHMGVCDGFANAYALAMNTLGIPCTVVSSYTRDHSWNIVQIDGLWYLCDLTNGIGTGNHEGMVMSYSSCLVGVNGFLASHPGYTMRDIYGEGNSDELNIRSLPLARADYIPNRSDLRMGIAGKSCLFFENGYWYWISTGNMLRRSRLNGSDATTVFNPKDDQYIGWAEEYDGLIYLSLNDEIYQMDMQGHLLSRVRKVSPAEYHHAVSSYFWQIAYVGRFHRNSDGTLGYYVTDLHGARKGMGRIQTRTYGRQYDVPQIMYGKGNIHAGYGKQLYVVNARPEDARQTVWASDDPSVASVSSTGYVTARKKGTTMISAVVGTTRIRYRVKVNGYTITYKKAGKNSAENVATASGKRKITLKKPKRKGYVFIGWYRDKARRHKITYIKKGNTRNYILYGKWKKEVR